MLEEVEKVKWLPSFVKERMLNWLINAEDWNISRQRYWGIPVPIWECKNKECKEVKIVSSLKELIEEARKSGKAIASNFDLHHASKVKLSCDACGSEMERVPYIFDVWFDSSIAAWASLGYPYYDDDLFDTLWPVDRINEGQDQIRGWFYVLLFSSVATFGKAPYKAVSMTGWILDAKGQKMSKSLGNVIYAKDAVEKLGADLLRFYILYDAPAYAIQSVNLDNANREPLKFFNILYNIYNFYKQIGPAEKLKEEAEDLWLKSRLNKLVKSYTLALENFELNIALRKLYDFVLNDFSRTYIKLVREKAENKKILIKETLKVLLKLLAPVSPFFSDWLWQKLKDNSDEISIVLEKWPKHKEEDINEELEKKFEIISKVVETALALRTERKINARWPLANLFVFTDKDEIKNAVEELSNLIIKQVNVKNLVVASSKEVTKEAKEVSGFWVDLSKELSNDLLAEGFAREIIRRVQAARKKLGLVKENEIELELVIDDELKDLLIKHNQVALIKDKVNASNFDLLKEASSKAFDIEEEFGVREKVIKIRVKKLG